MLSVCVQTCVVSGPLSRLSLTRGLCCSALEVDQTLVVPEGTAGGMWDFIIFYIDTLTVIE